MDRSKTCVGQYKRLQLNNARVANAERRPNNCYTQRKKQWRGFINIYKSHHRISNRNSNRTPKQRQTMNSVSHVFVDTLAAPNTGETRPKQDRKAYSAFACSPERLFFILSPGNRRRPLRLRQFASFAVAMADAKSQGRAPTTAPNPTPTPTWAERTEALTHILTHPSHSPSLHSQLFLASRVPCPPRGSSYPPFLCPGASLLQWALTSVFLPRAARLGLPPSSWRSRCPFQLPPPLVPSAGIEPAPERWGEAELRGYAQRRRARRGPMRTRPPVSMAGVVLTTVPNIVIIVVIMRELFWVRPGRF